MEVQYGLFHCHYILRYIVFSQNVFTITTFLNFIDPQHVQVIAQLALKTKRQQKFYRIAVAKHFVNAYLNRVDRSIFFLFYEEPQFQNIQKNTINALANRNYQFLEQAYHNFQALFCQLLARTSFLETKDQLKTIIQSVFFEPDMPMPKMKRQTIGMYCETPFQQFLCLKRFEDQQLSGENWMDQPLQQLKQKLQEQEAVGINANQSIIQKIMETVRYQGWLVNTQTWKTFLIQDFHTHNLIVILLAISSEMVETFNILLQNIEDPFMRFVEFNLRSSIYRNIVLAIEQRFSFAIKAYGSIYQNTYHPPPQIPNFNFWRPALSIWLQKMSRYHKLNAKIYDYISAKLRENSLLKYLGSKTQRLPSVYSELREEAQLNGFSEVLKDHAYAENGGNLEIQAFFENNEEIYEVLSKDYLQYSIDLSINEINVHWCGHSQHTIHKAAAFKEITAGFIQNSVYFYSHLQNLVQRAMPSDLKIVTYRQLLKQDLQLVQQKLAKPSVMKSLLQICNKSIFEIVDKIGQFYLFGEQIMKKYRIFLQFQEKDNLLQYFASKAEIPLDCPPSMCFFYDLQNNPQIEIPKIQIDALSEKSQDEEHQIYDSENEGNI